MLINQDKIGRETFEKAVLCSAHLQGSYSIVVYNYQGLFVKNSSVGGGGISRKGSYYSTFGVVSYVIGEGGGGGYGDILSQKIVVFFDP